MLSVGWAIRCHIRIGNGDPDSLLTYPDAHNLSGSVLPLRPAKGPTRMLAQLRGAGPLPARRVASKPGLKG